MKYRNLILLLLTLTSQAMLTARPWIYPNYLSATPAPNQTPTSKVSVMLDIDGGISTAVMIQNLNPDGETTYSQLTDGALESAGGWWTISVPGQALGEVRNDSNYQVSFFNSRGSASFRITAATSGANVVALAVLSNPSVPSTNPGRSRPPVLNPVVTTSGVSRYVSFSSDPFATTAWWLSPGGSGPQWINLLSVSYYYTYSACCYVSNEWGTSTLNVTQSGSYWIGYNP